MTIERNCLGVITGIVSPDNLRTEITVNQDFLLTGVDYADTSGRVTDAMDAEGGHWQFDSSYSSKGERVSVMTSAEGQSTTVLMGEASSGQRPVR